MAIDCDVGVLAHRLIHRAYQAHHVIDSTIAQASMVRIGAFGAGHIQIDLQSAESLRFFLESLAPIVLRRGSRLFAGMAKIISCLVGRALWLPRGWPRTQHLIQTLECFAAVAIGIDAHSIAKLA